MISGKSDRIARFLPNRSHSGFTLIEMVMVVVIVAVMAGMGIRSVLRILENRAFRETIGRMEDIRDAIAGNPLIVAEGSRLQFGYVGDTGQMPPDFAALGTDPGVPGWNGPYIETSKFQDNPDFLFQDGWNNQMILDIPTNTALPPTLTSTADGGDPIVLNIASSVDALINNTVALRIRNADGYPIRGTDGDLDISYAGTWHTMGYSSELGFNLTTVPIGSHEVRIIIAADTSYRIINVGANNSTTSPELGLEYTVNPNYGTLSYVGNSVSLGGTSDSEVTFNINNSGSTTFEVIEIQTTWSNSDCWECEYAYLANITVNTAAYWAWNTYDRAALASNSARLLLDASLNIPKGVMTIGPLGFQTLNDGTGNPQPMDDVNFRITLYSKTAPNQSISFSTPGTCTPAIIIQNLYTVSGDSSQNVAIQLRNSGNAPVTITGMTIICDATSAYLDEIAFGTIGDTYWKALQNWCNNYEGRKQMNNTTGSSITFCKTQPPARLLGGEEKILYLLNFFSDPIRTSSTYHKDMSAATFSSITLHFACGADQSVSAP
ncbi:MAG: prepilin-type N-terminal cleavage/methylation domain-containing protein [Candidatus Neomarinimicrobiota bacterium]